MSLVSLEGLNDGVIMRVLFKNISYVTQQKEMTV